MSNFECTVTIADIYGAEWWERNKAELEREWEWGFGVELGSNMIADKGCFTLQPINGHLPVGPRIILHRRKPKPPTLREVYGVDEVTIPVGWEWTGEWRYPIIGLSFLTSLKLVEPCVLGLIGGPRLILRERPKKVWFKAEERHRASKPGDWAWVIDQWKLVGVGTLKPFTLCATRHEEVDQTVQVVTQEDIDKCGR